MSERYIFLLLAMLYGAIATTGGWLVMQSERRQWWRHRFAAALDALWLQVSSPCKWLVSGAIRCLSGMFGAMHILRQNIRRHRPAALVMLALLVLPPSLALYFSTHGTLDGYSDAPDPAAPVIASLLRGEQLVPPPPLPPEIFLASDLGAIRAEITNASREWNLLNGDFRQRLLAVYRMMANHGYQMALIEGYRSPERQARLASLGPQVTNAGAYQSYHQYGLAADNAFFRDDKIVISEKDDWAMEGYRLFGSYAEAAGLVWGGRWQMKDFGHVELRKPGVLARHE